MEPSDPLDSQWISIHIRDHLQDRDINIRDSLVSPGDFHSPDNPLESLTESSIDKMIIPSEGLGEVCATGRRGSEGWLDLWDGEKKICELHWDNRTGRFHNNFEVLDEDDGYNVEASGWSSEKGPLGHVFVDVRERKKREMKMKKEMEAKELGIVNEEEVEGVEKSGVLGEGKEVKV
ncbi:Aegerolysin-domain-containing protein [Aspergillus karnatakaensis]|uniref:aegerolysin family protein n=1 Tax=Aspergillus karnatakaensis TaxID=1810916 RepID=UPI003CCCAC3B